VPRAVGLKTKIGTTRFRGRGTTANHESTAREVIPCQASANNCRRWRARLPKKE